MEPPDTPFADQFNVPQKDAVLECSNDWGEQGYDNSVPGDGTKTTPSGDKT